MVALALLTAVIWAVPAAAAAAAATPVAALDCELTALAATNGALDRAPVADVSRPPPTEPDCVEPGFDEPATDTHTRT